MSVVYFLGGVVEEHCTSTLSCLEFSGENLRLDLCLIRRRRRSIAVFLLGGVAMETLDMGGIRLCAWPLACALSRVSWKLGGSSS